MAEKKVIELEVKTNIKPLKTQLREAQQEVQVLSEKFGETSREAINAAKKAAELKDAIAEAKDLTDAFNPDAKFTALSNSIGGVTGGFEAFQGALGLVGVESEAVQKQLLKVQSAMALSQGLQSVFESVDGFKKLGAVIKSTSVFQGVLTAAQSLYAVVVGTTTGALKAMRLAMAATGIGALIIGVGLLISKVSEWANWTDEARKKQDKLNESLETQQTKLKKNREELQKDLEFKVKLAEAEGKSGSELLKLKESNANKTNAQIYKEIEAARARLKVLREVDLGVMASSKEEYDELVKKNIAKRKEVVKEINDLKGEIKAGNQDLLVEKTKFETESTKVVEKGTKSREKIVDDSKAKAKKKREDELKALEDLADDMQASGKKRSDKQLEDQRKAAADELQIQSDKIIAQAELDKENARLKEEADKKEEERLKNLEAAKYDVAKNGFITIGNLATAFAGESEKEQKKAFEIQKAANIAGAIIDTIRATIGAFKSGNAIGGPILGFAQAGIAAAGGAVMIRQLEQSTFNGRGATNAPSNSGGNNNQVVTPNFNIIGNQNQTQLAQLNQAPIKAYVVGSDVTTQQMLDKKKIQNATL